MRKKRIDLTLNDFDIVNLDMLCFVFHCSKSELFRWFITNASKSSVVMKQFCKDTGRDFLAYRNGYYSQFDIIEKNDDSPRREPRKSSFDYCQSNYNNSCSGISTVDVEDVPDGELIKLVESL